MVMMIIIVWSRCHWQYYVIITHTIQPRMTEEWMNEWMMLQIKNSPTLVSKVPALKCWFCQHRDPNPRHGDNSWGSDKSWESKKIPAPVRLRSIGSWECWAGWVCSLPANQKKEYSIQIMIGCCCWSVEIICRLVKKIWL